MDQHVLEQTDPEDSLGWKFQIIHLKSAHLLNPAILVKSFRKPLQGVYWPTISTINKHRQCHYAEFVFLAACGDFLVYRWRKKATENRGCGRADLMSVKVI